MQVENGSTPNEKKVIVIFVLGKDSSLFKFNDVLELTSSLNFMSCFIEKERARKDVV